MTRQISEFPRKYDRSDTPGGLDGQGARVRVEDGRYADRHRHLIATVSDGQSAEHWYAEHSEVLAKNVRHGGEPIVGAVGELSDSDACDVGESTGAAQLEQHS